MENRSIASRGRLFVLEGVDGVGKTTLAEGLRQRLGSLGIPSGQASFPGQDAGSLAAHIYRLYHRPADFGVKALNQSSMQTLLTAAHVEVIQTRILPALQRGENIILDRYWWSTWVYGRASGVPFQILDCLLALEELAWAGATPSVVFLVKRSPALIHKRRGVSTVESKRSWLYSRLAGQERRQKRYSVATILNDGTIAQGLDTIINKLMLAGAILPKRTIRSTE